MRRAVLVLTAGIALIAFTGCAGIYRTPVQPPQGTAFTNIQAPVSTDFNEETPAGMETGKASTQNILGLVAWGDASVEQAAENGDLSRVNHVDYKFLNVLGIYSQYTTVAHGE